MVIKVLTFNVHSFIGLRGQNSLVQIADMINEYEPTIVGLNEVERLTPRNRFADQPKQLARLTRMEYVFGPAIRVGPLGFFGNALLSHFPILKWENFKMPSKRETRALLLGQVQLPGAILKVIVTHLGLNRQERAQQIEYLAGVLRTIAGPYIVLGDFNAPSEELAPLNGLVRDIGEGSGATYPANNPTARIDYIVVSNDIVDYNVHTLSTEASDHLPVIAIIEV